METKPDDSNKKTPAGNPGQTENERRLAVLERSLERIVAVKETIDDIKKEIDSEMERFDFLRGVIISNDEIEHLKVAICTTRKKIILEKLIGRCDAGTEESAGTDDQSASFIVKGVFVVAPKTSIAPGSSLSKCFKIGEQDGHDVYFIPE